MESHAIATPRHATGGLLRFALTLDGVATGANGVLYLAGAPLLDGWLGLPTEMLMAVGAFLIAYAALVLRLATRPAMPRVAVVAVIAANVLWAVDSLIALALDWFTPTTVRPGPDRRAGGAGGRPRRAPVRRASSTAR